MCRVCRVTVAVLAQRRRRSSSCRRLLIMGASSRLFISSATTDRVTCNCVYCKFQSVGCSAWIRGISSPAVVSLSAGRQAL
jgi:hypothetical protein